MFLLRNRVSLVEAEVGSRMHAVTMDGREDMIPSLVRISCTTRATDV